MTGRARYVNQSCGFAELAAVQSLPDGGAQAIDIEADNGPHPSFLGTATAAGGSRTFTYNSAAGGMRR